MLEESGYYMRLDGFSGDFTGAFDRMADKLRFLNPYLGADRTFNNPSRWGMYAAAENEWWGPSSIGLPSGSKVRLWGLYGQLLRVSGAENLANVFNGAFRCLFYRGVLGISKLEERDGRPASWARFSRANYFALSGLTLLPRAVLAGRGYRVPVFARGAMPRFFDAADLEGFKTRGELAKAYGKKVLGYYRHLRGDMELELTRRWLYYARRRGRRAYRSSCFDLSTASAFAARAVKARRLEPPRRGATHFRPAKRRWKVRIWVAGSVAAALRVKNRRLLANA